MTGKNMCPKATTQWWHIGAVTINEVADKMRQRENYY